MGWGRGQRPVINVSWNDSKAYITWLSHKTGKGYRLLTEGEREYVTRAGTTTPFWWGSSISTLQANYNGNSVYGNGTKGGLIWIDPDVARGARVVFTVPAETRVAAQV